MSLNFSPTQKVYVVHVFSLYYNQLLIWREEQYIHVYFLFIELPEKYAHVSYINHDQTNCWRKCVHLGHLIRHRQTSSIVICHDLKDLSKVLDDHGRHSMLSFLSSLPISVLRILDTEANKFYDRNHQLYDAALLTRCYTQHALRPFIDSEINHTRHFIKIPFINKGIEFIDLPSIFKDRSVTSSIPAYFRNSEPPIICYKYNKPIRNTVFNFNKLVSDLDIHANTPES